MSYKITDVWIYRPHGIIFPEPVIDKLNTLIGLDGKKTLHLFSGKSKVGVTCDVNNTFGPAYNIDCSEKLPFDDMSFDNVIADPPYYDGHDYGVKPYCFVAEAVRVLKIGGFIAIMHPLRYAIPKGCIGYALIGVSTGPNLKARFLNVFQKIEHIENKFVNSNGSMRKMV